MVNISSYSYVSLLGGVPISEIGCLLGREAEVGSFPHVNVKETEKQRSMAEKPEPIQGEAGGGKDCSRRST